MAFSKGLLVVPLVLAIASFALSIVALMAGAKPGQMEDFHVIAVSVVLLLAGRYSS
jgi:general stress protein CsbA